MATCVIIRRCIRSRVVKRFSTDDYLIGIRHARIYTIASQRLSFGRGVDNLRVVWYTASSPIRKTHIEYSEKSEMRVITSTWTWTTEGEIHDIMYMFNVVMPLQRCYTSEGWLFDQRISERFHAKVATVFYLTATASLVYSFAIWWFGQ